MKAPLVILGATGGIGRGVVQAAVEDGRPVIAVGRDPERLRALRQRHPQADLTLLPGAINGDADGAALAAVLRRQRRPLAGVVASVCGGLERGRLLDQPAAFLRHKLDEDLLPHLAAARHLLPLLAEADRGGGYVLIGGPGDEQPWAGYGHRSIGAAALRMLARVLHDEARALSVRVQLLAVDTPVRTDSNRDCACPEWPCALAVGRRALGLLDRSEPAEAVVSYTARREIPPDHREAPPPRLSSPDSARDSTRHSEQAADGDANLLPARCLQDARNLLSDLSTPHRHEAPR